MSQDKLANMLMGLKYIKNNKAYVHGFTFHLMGEKKDNSQKDKTNDKKDRQCK